MRSAVTPASHMSGLPAVLSIAGSDSGGGAGIQADLLTFAAHGVHGTTAITCLTAQNPDAVSGLQPVPVDSVLDQMESVYRYFRPRAAKAGMLFSAEIISAVAGFFEKHRRIPFVVDPVMVATSGAILLRDEAIGALTTRLFPLARVITPNLDEGAVLLGCRPEDRAEVIDAAICLAGRYNTNVLLKGGHLPGRRLVDVLADPKGRVHIFEGSRIAGVDTHGSGCTLSAAIAANLALGQELKVAVAAARCYLRAGMTRPLKIAGRRFIAH